MLYITLFALLADMSCGKCKVDLAKKFPTKLAKWEEEGGHSGIFDEKLSHAQKIKCSKKVDFFSSQI